MILLMVILIFEESFVSGFSDPLIEIHGLRIIRSKT